MLIIRRRPSLYSKGTPQESLYVNFNVAFPFLTNIPFVSKYKAQNFRKLL